MSVRVEGDLDFQNWYYDKYHDVAPIVSHDIYAEYLEYKSQKWRVMFYRRIFWCVYIFLFCFLFFAMTYFFFYLRC